PQLQIFNRGIGGNGIADLLGRWQTDCLALKPRVLSILAGINDVALSVNSGEPCDARLSAEFESTYRTILRDTKQTLPQGARILGPRSPTVDSRGIQLCL
ncbi:MAG: GDSL-type esterase/lipase family protein, partial [Gemmatimonadota bacterium]